MARPNALVGPSTPDSASPYEVLFGPWSRGVAAVVLVGAALSAVSGATLSTGLDLCWLRLATDLPCPGCGLTRSVSALARGELTLAARYHPFGLLLLLYAALAASSQLWPASWRRESRRRLERRSHRVRRLYGAVVTTFVAFGVLRAIGVAAGLWPDLP